MRRTVLVLAAAFALGGGAKASERVVSLGGDVTEIVFALGEGSRIVCVDETSRYPRAATALPQVGYVRNLAAEGILSCRPDLVIAAADAGPSAVLSQLRDAGVPVVSVSGKYSFEGALTKIDDVAAALGIAKRGSDLRTKLEAEMKAVDAALVKISDRPKALFLLAQGPAGAQAGGDDTAAQSILAMAKATNAGKGFHGYKPLTGEAAAALAPDVIVVADFSAAAMGGVAAMRARPEIALTPAGKSGRVIVVDTMLMLGFGPRTPEAVATLAQALHPGLKLDLAAR